MSAYISSIYSDRVEILSDAAIFDPADYTLVGICKKCIQIGSLPLAMTSRGNMSALGQITVSLILETEGMNVDSALAHFAAKLQIDKDAGKMLPDQDFLIAGWSETMGPFHKHVVGPGAQMAGLEPYVLLDAPSFMSGGTFDDDDFYENGFYVDQFDNTLSYYGMKLMDAFRRKPVYTPDHPERPICGIGGQIHMTTIRQSGVEFKPLGYWPDMIGSQIVPNACLYPAP